jgi:hypothetical protein
MSRLTLKEAIERIKSRFKKYENAEVRVGFLSGATYENGTALADVAFWNDQGTKRGIPARPFISQAKAVYGAKWEEGLKRSIANGVSFEAALAQLGEAVSGDIKHHLAKRVWAPNAESTAARKGFSKPLVDTGTMLGSVEYDVTINGRVTANKYGANIRGAAGRKANKKRNSNEPK